MKKAKENINYKGITLISLVVTIIVLLILAGVSISTLTGNNGLLTKTEEANEKAVEREQIALAFQAAVLDNIKNDFIYGVTAKQLRTELKTN